MSEVHIRRFDEMKASGQLPSPTGVALAILRLSEKESTTQAELARVLQTDPALTGRLFKFANSSVFGTGRQVASVQEAIARIGMRRLKDIALGFSLLSNHQAGSCKKFDYPNYWSVSLASALATQALASLTKKMAPDDAYTCGLLCKIGQLALASVYPTEYAEVLEGLGEDQNVKSLIEAEEKRFSTSYPELSAAMLEDWGMPEVICYAARFQNSPEDEGITHHERAHFLAQLLNLGLQVGEVCVAKDERRRTLVPKLFEQAKAMSLDDEATTKLCDAVACAWRDWGEILHVKTAEIPSFAEMAHKAKEFQTASKGYDEGEARQGLRILVVDDDPIELRLLIKHLTGAGHFVQAATNGEEGLTLALRGDPQLIITDWMMPEMDWLAFCRALRQTKLGRQVYVLMLTGQEGEDQLVEAFEAGADDYVFKPFRPKTLLARIRASQRVIELKEEIARDKEELRKQTAELAIVNRQLQEMALTDALTKLCNRRYAMDRLEQEWSAAQRHNLPLGVLIVDVDHFKKVNDTFGHDVGDIVLRDVANLLKTTCRQSDVPCRLGGEEFLIICPRTEGEDVFTCGERLRAAVDAHTVIAPGVKHKVTISVGAASVRDGYDSMHNFITAADQALYKAKSSGRNRVLMAKAGAALQSVG